MDSISKEMNLLPQTLTTVKTMCANSNTIKKLIATFNISSFEEVEVSS